MKKTLISLAALMMLMAAPVMTSCSKDTEDAMSIEQSRIATIEIAFPEQADTRAVIENNIVTAWKAGDKVTLYKVSYDEEDTEYIIDASAEFTFVSGSTFSGELPEDVSSVSEFDYAVHHGTMVIDNETLYFYPSKQVATDLADVLMMIGEKDGNGNFKMKITGNYFKLVNNSGDISAVLKVNNASTYCYITPTWTYDLSTETFGVSCDAYPIGLIEYASFTIEGGKTNYILVGNDDGCIGGIGVIKVNGDWIINPKRITGIGITGNIIYNAGSYPSN